MKPIILASIFTLIAGAAFAQVAPPAAGGAPAAGAPAAGAPAGAAAGGGGAAPAAPPQAMSFFVTSKVPGTGNLGGLAGADKICQDLAAAVSSTKTFHAYLSTQDANGQTAVNARDRIGNGPWYNSKGTLIAMNVADLHGDTNRDRNAINKLNSLDEHGVQIPGFEAPQGQNQHDMLTGTDSDGKAFPAGMDMTCSNWTSDATAGRAMLGHTDREGGQNTSWNAAHLSAGCDTAGLIRTGGNGRFYCFAIN